MAFEQKDLSGSLFVNSKKESERHPDWTGTCRIEGKDYWVSMWQSDGRSAKTHSLAFKAKDGTAARPDDKAAEFKRETEKHFPGARVALDDEVPFAPEVR